MSYRGGFLDGTIEGVHKALGIGLYGRSSVARNTYNVILDLKGVNTPLLLNAPSDGGPHVRSRLFPVAAAPSPWNLVLEGAVKVPIDGEREFLSNGNIDVGLQATLQRFAGRHAGYVSAAAVRTKGGGLTSNDRSQIVPTYIVGYEYSVTERTGVIAQLYAAGACSGTRTPPWKTCLDQVSGLGRRAPSHRRVGVFVRDHREPQGQQHTGFGFQIG